MLTGLKIHYLKIMPKYYDSLKHGYKPFEIRKNDRDFKVGDILTLQEYDIEAKEYTESDELYFDITYILDDVQYLQDGYICMGIKKR